MRSMLRQLASSISRRGTHNVMVGCSHRCRYVRTATNSHTGVVTSRHLSGTTVADGETITRSPLPDEQLDVQTLSDYIFSKTNLYGSRIALVSETTSQLSSFGLQFI